MNKMAGSNRKNNNERKRPGERLLWKQGSRAATADPSVCLFDSRYPHPVDTLSLVPVVAGIRTRRLYLAVTLLAASVAPGRPGRHIFSRLQAGLLRGQRHPAGTYLPAPGLHSA